MKAESQVSQHQPDVILMDIEMLGMNGITGLIMLLAEGPHGGLVEK